MTAVMLAVPWWVWAVLAGVIGFLATFWHMARRAPMDTELWEDGEPRRTTRPWWQR